MKITALFAMLGIGLLAGGCLTDGSQVTLAPVGPAPAAGPAATSADGSLTVYSAFEVNADFNRRDPSRPEYSDYRIYDMDGKLLKLVTNDTGITQESTATVGLPAGRYLVKARANGYGTLSVPVIIAAGRNTCVHLEGGSAGPDKSQFEATHVVRLPNGNVIGWRG